ncbi:MAG TPA: hypothetical protein VMM83_02575 [Longimicrobiales bacterium]|nr:hypothetical protein [Longimicrobiales bacterium]
MDAREYGLPESVPCPFCDEVETELHSAFGPALSVATYWCRRCRTSFEWVKWDDPKEKVRPEIKG